MIAALGTPIGTALLSCRLLPTAERPRRGSVDVRARRAARAGARRAGFDGAARRQRGSIARALGFAGPGHEATVGIIVAQRATSRPSARRCARSHASVRRTPPRSSRPASRKDAAGSCPLPSRRSGTFPKPEADRQVIGLLSRRDFVVRQPDAAGRLIDHAPREHANTAAILEPLLALRYRIWNPSLARIGRKARALLLAG